ncbi:hypothetical protein ACFSKI_03370 [Pseudogracilibacillus auburnensis]|uniref:Uncharacterized protein n=1 Tax=Pseudogracilibacillus auburnensis TaxID=1494959 RepID=A0A2V3W724_9BACI|nr:hypothetical protein [Pseudogracilibacillus auburnensis]PXW88055.1 hypothetical protein DFR56_104207 [Pseudogracilibacillus auburnensis]
MEWFMIVMIILIGFIPIVYRMNQRIHQLELKIHETMAQLKVRK